MWLNLHGRGAVWRKLKNSLKTQKMHFLPVFDLTSVSLLAVKVEPHQCPLHQLILLTQRPILEIFAKRKLRIWGVENLSFLSRPFWFFFASSSWKSVNIYNVARKFWNFDDYQDFQLRIRCSYTFATQCTLFSVAWCKIDEFYVFLVDISWLELWDSKQLYKFFFLNFGPSVNVFNPNRPVPYKDLPPNIDTLQKKGFQTEYSTGRFSNTLSKRKLEWADRVFVFFKPCS